MNQVNQNPAVSVSYASNMLPPYLEVFGKEYASTMLDLQWDPFPNASLMGRCLKINVRVDKWFISEKFKQELKERCTANLYLRDGDAVSKGHGDDVISGFNTRLAVIDHFGLSIVYNQNYVKWFRENIKDFLVEAYLLEPDNLNSLRVFQDKTYTAKEWFGMVADHIYLNDI